MHLKCAGVAPEHAKVHSMQNAQRIQGDCLLQVPLQKPRQDLLAGGKFLTRHRFRDVDSSSKVGVKVHQGKLRADQAISPVIDHIYPTTIPDEEKNIPASRHARTTRLL
jgi:hypothetical protein